jgi:hypothetical protein
MLEMLFDKFTSRKFILAAVTYVVGLLVAAGVISPDAQSQLVDGIIQAGTLLAPIIYIIVEGFIDHKAADPGTPSP